MLCGVRPSLAVQGGRRFTFRVRVKIDVNYFGLCKVIITFDIVARDKIIRSDNSVKVLQQYLPIRDVLKLRRWTLDDTR